MAQTFKVGMIGAGLESASGEIHREAIRLTGRAELACGAFGSTRHHSFQTGTALNLPPDRVYGTYRDLFRRESRLPADKQPDFVSIIVPNNMHYPIAMAAFDVGFNVFCCSPMTTNMDEALNLERKRSDRGLAYGLWLPFAAFPMVFHARALVQAGELGSIRKVVVTYPKGWLATRLETAGNKQAGWRTDPRRAGPSCCMADLGLHCAFLSEFVTGQSITKVCADLLTFVAGRPLDDDGTVLLHFDRGAHGAIWASQVCSDHVSPLCVRVWGSTGSIEWHLNEPERLLFTPLHGSVQMIDTSSPDLCAEAKAALRFPYDATAPLVAPLAHQYDAFIDRLGSGNEKPTLASPSTAEGIRTMSFLDAVLRNTHPDNTEKWTPVPALDVGR